MLILFIVVDVSLRYVLTDQFQFLWLNSEFRIDEPIRFVGGVVIVYLKELPPLDLQRLF